MSEAVGGIFEVRFTQSMSVGRDRLRSSKMHIRFLSGELAGDLGDDWSKAISNKPTLAQTVRIILPWRPTTEKMKPRLRTRTTTGSTRRPGLSSV